MEKTLKIKCTGEIKVDFRTLKDLQLTESGKSLKTTSTEKINKLAESLKEYGIVNNLQVWVKGDDTYCFDAHHRKKALALIEKDGWEIPLLPATRCLAEDKREAKRLLLLKESTNSWIDSEVIEDFLTEIDFGIEEAKSVIEIPELEWPGEVELIKYGEQSSETPHSQYGAIHTSSKVHFVFGQYEATMEKSDLIDRFMKVLEGKIVGNDIKTAILWIIQSALKSQL